MDELRHGSVDLCLSVFDVQTVNLEVAILYVLRSVQLCMCDEVCNFVLIRALSLGHHGDDVPFSMSEAAC